MKLIELTRDYVALVDDADFEDLSRFKWCVVCPSSTHRYATRIIHRNGQSTRQTMHRYLLGLTDPGIMVDHSNGDGLDNRRFNLRICTRCQNNSNRKVRPASIYKGVRLRGIKRKAWTVMCKGVYIGSFKTEEQAARAYDAAALSCYGEFACLNFPKPWQAICVNVT